MEQDLVRRKRNGIKLFDFAQPTARSMKPDRGGMLAADGRQSLFVRLPLAAQVVNGFGAWQCPLLTSDKHAAYPTDKPVTPADLAATIFSALGFNPNLRLRAPEGQPTPLVDGGKTLGELFG